MGGYTEAPSFERNEHGHVVITFAGLDLTGAQEIERLEAKGFRLDSYAKSCFLSTAADSYDNKHRLVAEQQYRVALVPSAEIEHHYNRIARGFLALGIKYAYGKPLGGHVPRISETISDKQMEDIGIWYIASLHEPIKASDNNPSVLNTRSEAGGRRVGTGRVRPNNLWFDRGAFAFPIN